MSWLLQLIVRITKGLFFSVFAGLFCFIITVSIINGRFPPTINDLKVLKQKIDYVFHWKNEKSPWGTAQNNSAIASVNQGTMNNSRSGYQGNDRYYEPELADMESVKNYHQRQAKVSQSLLEGEMTFASTPPLDSPNHSNPTPSEVLVLKERVRKLEDLVFHMQEQIKHLNTRINVQKK